MNFQEVPATLCVVVLLQTRADEYWCLASRPESDGERIEQAWLLLAPAQACVDLLLSGLAFYLLPADTLRSARADSIEANVESAEVHVERGTEQLQRAAYYQVGSSSLCWEQEVFTHHLLLSSAAAKVAQEDVCSCCGVLRGAAHTGHHHLERVPLSRTWTFTLRQTRPSEDVKDSCCINTSSHISTARI